MRRLALLTALIAALVAAQPVAAHNAGHLYVDGRCLGVGSDRPAPYVGPGAPQDATGRLDLIYDPRNGVDTTDQYGARFAANQGNTPILPGDCPQF